MGSFTVLGWVLGFGLVGFSMPAHSAPKADCPASGDMGQNFSDLKSAGTSLAQEIPLRPDLGYRVLDRSLEFQGCVFQKKMEVLRTLEKNPEDLARMEKLFPVVMDAQKQLNEVLKWSLRVMDRNLARNAVSLAWNEFAPGDLKDEAHQRDWVSAFENLDRLMPPLKRSSLDILKSMNLITESDQINYQKNYVKPKEAKKKNHDDPDYFKTFLPEWSNYVKFNHARAGACTR